MAKRQVAENTAEESNELISSLISGSEFKFIGSGEDDTEGKGSLSDKPKVETPLHALNCLLGGGLPLGSILEVFGPNASGKSSLMYETLGNFQKQYPNGVAFIIDSESSTDDSRLRQLGVDPLRAPRMGASTLEDGFAQINFIMKKMIKDSRYKGFPVFILWDTIAACPTKAQLEKEDMYGGGMAERARIIKSALMTIFPLIEKQNVILVLLNQVMAEIGGWRPGLTSGGGNALKHDIHMRLEITGGKTQYDGVYPVSKFSNLSVSKSKVSPIMNDFPVIIDITKGGVIDRPQSLVWWTANLTNPAVYKQSSWWQVEDWCMDKYRAYWEKFPRFCGKFRQAELYSTATEDENFVDLLQLIWTDLISDRYVLQREVCQDLRVQLESRLMKNLGLTYDQVHPVVSETVEATDTSVSSDDLSELAGALGGVDLETGEVKDE